jgi:FAD/FMN-containing dehydrogenase
MADSLREPALLDALRGALGAAHVLTAAAEVEPFAVDWRRRYRQLPLAVASPANSSEVANVVRLAAAAGVAIVPQGGNTGLVGGAIPATAGREIVLSLRRLARVRAIDADNATMTVEAGVTLQAAQDAARAAGYLFPLSLAAEGSCTIGGNLSTNAGGTAVLRFGNMRELVLGVEVVLPDGQLWDGLRRLRKDNTGYDLKQLFIGAEGTLGVVTAAVLKLFPLARSSATALAAVVDARAAIALLRELRAALGDRLTGFELMHADCLRLVERHIPQQRNPLPGHPWYCLIQLDESAADEPLSERLQAALERARVVDAALAQSEAQARALWTLRENISEAERLEGFSIKHDVSLPVSAIAEFLERAGPLIGAALPGARIVAFGHLGDGNLHYNVAAPAQADSAEFVARNSSAASRLVHDLVHSLDGSISAEHGLGQLKREEICRYKSEVELDLMRRVKQALDPRGLMNPGKLV